MKISATLNKGRRIHEAVGWGRKDYEAILAVMISGKAFATVKQITSLKESIEAVLVDASKDTIEIDYEQGGWAVHIDW
jgi:hypothetical protein